MGWFFTELFSLREHELQFIINVILGGLIFTFFVVPVIMITKDILARYDNRWARLGLVLSLIFFYPFFILLYPILRAKHTTEELELLKKEERIGFAGTSLKTCPKCEDICKETDKFCKSCGFHLLLACKKCKSGVEFHWNYCNACGNQLRKPKVDIQKEVLTIRNRKLVHVIGYKLNHLIYSKNS